MRATAARGVKLRRARIVSEPVSEYIRFEHDGTPQNIAAGEDVRWLPRARASALSLPGNDCWVKRQVGSPPIRSRARRPA